jgi:hypothetical protein
VAKSLGSRNLFSASSVDQMPKHVSSGMLFGGPLLFPVPDLDRTDYLFMLGSNPWESNGSLCTALDFPGRVKAIQARGGKVVVVDPRRSRTAEEADEHLAVRPGPTPTCRSPWSTRPFAEDLVDMGALAPTSPASTSCVAARRSPRGGGPTVGIDAEVIRRLAREWPRPSARSTAASAPAPSSSAPSPRGPST